MVSYNFESDFQDLSTISTEPQTGLKACLFNLIVISYDLERSLYCQELVRIITERFPCSILFVRAEQDSPYDNVRLTKSTQVVGTESSKILCDVTAIEASVSQINQVPFLILPSIIPDLPVYIVLAHDPTQDHLLLDQVKSLASRVIFGMAHVDNVQRFAKAMQQLIQANHTQYIDINYIDIQWARSKAWREVLGKVFADQEKLQAIETASNIHIVFTAHPGMVSTQYELQALYLQAWIASRFGWKVVQVEGPRPTPRITYKTRTGTMTITLGVQDSEVLERGAIWSIEVMGGNDHHFLISHERDSKHVKVHASGPDRCEMPYTIFMNNYQRGAALINELFYQPASDHYPVMLKTFDCESWNQHSSKYI